MDKYEQLKYIIESDPKNVLRYKPNRPGAPTENGWMEIPYLSIMERDGSDYKKPGGVFSVRNSRLPYSTKKKLRAFIEIFVFDPNQSDKKATSETKFAMLAHEYGHFISLKNKMRPIGYDEARSIFSLGEKFYHRLTKEEKLMILEEERRAWIEGIKFVKSKGFKLTPEFYRRKRAALATYQRALSLK